ncbi:methyl-viologen-reducing hydrogenase delta subunit [Methanosalsum zhilinae DSM 4017]|uniref:CoB--CoM heterodisulfide reductase iron-sulfur subunit A n=1 Tax=Methanosalsum zhilinae (strain DSM 4017 / NBRC 107636 / OCM 62 / WeN5) TaxID=679901 RepID=F7XK56_METZD|nr:CoB-CoM heterodisulfide reductase HdrA2 [Methanosalsum zhilinae]AEH60521.1 methyl-viologen-reducing hydrogenase delta subunit [Methanosalsum zhilinae DSM 4017]
MKIGVYICHCGLNIANVINVDILHSKVEKLEDVAVVRDVQFMCSDAGQEYIIEDIGDNNLDRILVAACSPKLHEQTFRRVIEKAGINPYLLEMVNIREQCSWVHGNNPQMATQKAFDLIKMGLARLKHSNPLDIEKFRINTDVLVIGGGVTGIEASLNLADSGYNVHLIEQEPTIGGKMALINEVFPTNDCSICVLAPKMTEVHNHPNITLLTLSQITEITGNVGNFKIKGVKRPRYVLEDKCKGCVEDCSGVCPVEIPSKFDYGLGKKKAISIPIPQSVPQVAYINSDYCVGCGLCSLACPAEAIDYKQKEEEFIFNAGAIIVSTGYSLFDASRKEEYGYGIYPDVITNMELERLLNASGPTRGRVVVPSSGKVPERVAFIQCVGSRDESVDNPYCSRVCCMASMKNAQLLKERYPQIEIVIHYIDVRASGEMYEEYYTKTQSMGIDFIRGKASQVLMDKQGRPALRFEDTLESEIRQESYDMIVLATGMEAPENSRTITRMLNLSCRADRFYSIAHPKMRPVDSHIDGVFIAGCATGPKDIQSSIAQGCAAAAKVMKLLGSGELEADPLCAVVEKASCVGCGLCEDVCIFGKIRVIDSKAVVDEISCQGCGTCSAACPTDAIDMRHFTDEQIFAQIEAAVESRDEFPLIIGFLCNWCSYSCADLAGVSRIDYSTNIRIIRTMCAGRVDPEFVIKALEGGADGVLVAGCKLGECHYVHANYSAKKRLEALQNVLEETGIDPSRLRLLWISASECEKFAKTVDDFVDNLKNIGPVGHEILEAAD